MKFKILRSSFFKTLSHLQGIVDKKNSLPILSNILIEAKEKSLQFRLESEKEINKNSKNIEKFLRNFCQPKIKKQNQYL